MPHLGLGVGAWVVVSVGLGHVGQVPGTWASENPCDPHCLLLSPGGPFLPPTSVCCPQREGGADEESAVSRVICLRHIPGGWAALFLASHQAEDYRVNVGLVCG